MFKGGTCLKKCYFESYRFSEDLDFTVTNLDKISPKLLNSIFSDIAEWIYDNSGIELMLDRSNFVEYQNPRENISCQGKIFYRGPITPSAPQQIPRIKLDISTDELLVEKPVMRKITHPYSDYQDEFFKIYCYSYAEVFAEKIRALAERTRPRDLYDVISFFRRPESKDIAIKVKAILSKKCTFKDIPVPTALSLLKHKDECYAGWEQQLAHQLQDLPSFSVFWDELGEFFKWLKNNQINNDLFE